MRCSRLKSTEKTNLYWFHAFLAKDCQIPSFLTLNLPIWQYFSKSILRVNIFDIFEKSISISLPSVKIVDGHKHKSKILRTLISALFSSKSWDCWRWRFYDTSKESQVETQLPFKIWQSMYRLFDWRDDLLDLLPMWIQFNWRK